MLVLYSCIANSINFASFCYDMMQMPILDALRQHIALRRIVLDRRHIANLICYFIYLNIFSIFSHKTYVLEYAAYDLETDSSLFLFPFA